jgi:hypothetical protein
MRRSDTKVPESDIRFRVPRFIKNEQGLYQPQTAKDFLSRIDRQGKRAAPNTGSRPGSWQPADACRKKKPSSPLAV